jgi:nitrate/nitrite-specific signal transduction histidine kinase
MNQDLVEELVGAQQEITQVRSLSSVLRFLQPVKHKVSALLGVAPSFDSAFPTIEEDLYTFLRTLSTSGVRCEITTIGHSREFNPEARQQIGQITREALVNALLHSGASCIEAEIEYRPRRLRVMVRDNGRGIEPEQVQSQGTEPWGLSRMRRQAEKIGGQLTVWSRAGAGTEVEISAPIQVLVDACA